jgi:hypothetical protein
VLIEDGLRQASVCFARVLVEFERGCRIRGITNRGGLVDSSPFLGDSEPVVQNLWGAIFGAPMVFPAISPARESRLPIDPEGSCSTVDGIR